MIKQVLLYFFTTTLPMLFSPWFWLGVSYIAVVYKQPFPLWFVTATWVGCFYNLIDKCELFRGGVGLDSRYTIRLSSQSDVIERRQKIYRLLKGIAEIAGYPNCSIKFESEEKDGDLFRMTYRIPNRNVYIAIDEFLSEIKEEKVYVN